MTKSSEKFQNYVIGVDVSTGSARAGLFDGSLCRRKIPLFKTEVPVGDAADLYSETRKKTPEIPMGELHLNEGANRVMFKIVGKNEQRAGLVLIFTG